MVLFRKVTSVQGGQVPRKYKLRVQAYGPNFDPDTNDGTLIAIPEREQTIDIWVNPENFAEVGLEIFFPGNNYLITRGELAYFATFGSTDAGKPITAVTLGGKDADSFSTEATGWVAEFTGLGLTPGEGPHTLVVSNIDTSKIRNVTIEADVGDDEIEIQLSPEPPIS